MKRYTVETKGKSDCRWYYVNDANRFGELATVWSSRADARVMCAALNEREAKKTVKMIPLKPEALGEATKLVRKIGAKWRKTRRAK